MAARGEHYYNPFDDPSEVGYDDHGADGSDNVNPDEMDADSLRLSDAFVQHWHDQFWNVHVKRPPKEEAFDPWAPPELVETSMDSTDDERIDTSFSPERRSLFPPMEELLDPEQQLPSASWSPDRSHFSSPSNSRGSPSRGADLRQQTTGTTKVSPKASLSVNSNNTSWNSIQIKMEERLSILFESGSSEPICRVIGRIHVVDTPLPHQPPYKRGAAAASPIPEKFCLTVRDRRGYVEQWDAQSEICQEDLEATSRLTSLQGNDRIFRVNTTGATNPSGLFEAPILEYICTPKLKPIPLLLKTKIQPENAGCKLGIRIRANPSNFNVITNMVVMVVVPPEMDGSNIIQPSYKGGIWDDLKRTLTWTAEQLPPGECLDIQTIFPYVSETAGAAKDYRFPILLRCNGGDLFSKLEIRGNTAEEPSRPLTMDVNRMTTVLYRKTS